MSGYWIIPVVFGIALMLGVSSVPAFADPIVLACFGHVFPEFLCTAQPNTGDHALLITGSNIRCHADVIFVDGSTVSMMFSDHPRCQGVLGVTITFSFSVFRK